MHLISKSVLLSFLVSMSCKNPKEDGLLPSPKRESSIEHHSKGVKFDSIAFRNLTALGKSREILCTAYKYTLNAQKRIEEKAKYAEYKAKCSQLLLNGTSVFVYYYSGIAQANDSLQIDANRVLWNGRLLIPLKEREIGSIGLIKKFYCEGSPSHAMGENIYISDDYGVICRDFVSDKSGFIYYGYQPQALQKKLRENLDFFAFETRSGTLYY